MALRSCSVILNGRFRTISRLARFGADAFVVFGVCFDGALARLSKRFFKVTDSKEPLKTCAWSLLTASCADAEVENSTCAETMSESRISNDI